MLIVALLVMVCPGNAVMPLNIMNVSMIDNELKPPPVLLHPIIGLADTAQIALLAGTVLVLPAVLVLLTVVLGLSLAVLATVVGMDLIAAHESMMNGGSGPSTILYNGGKVMMLYILLYSFVTLS